VLEVRDKAVEDLRDLDPTVYPVGSYLDRQNQKRRCCEIREDGVMLLIGRLRGAKPAEMMMRFNHPSQDAVGGVSLIHEKSRKNVTLSSGNRTTGSAAP